MHNEIFGVSEGHLYGQFLSSDIFCNDFRLNCSPIILCTTIAKHKNIIIYIYIYMTQLFAIANNTITYTFCTGV